MHRLSLFTMCTNVQYSNGRQAGCVLLCVNLSFNTTYLNINVLKKQNNHRTYLPHALDKFTPKNVRKLLYKHKINQELTNYGTYIETPMSFLLMQCYSCRITK